MTLRLFIILADLDSSFGTELDSDKIVCCYLASRVNTLRLPPTLGRFAQLCALSPHWRIWHPFDDPGCYRVTELREALLTASDHYPVSIDLPI